MVEFEDRRDAGRRLVPRLLEYRSPRPLALGLARGGMVVASEVANGLGADLDVFVARKVGAPFNPEYGIGAVGPDGVRAFDRRAVDALGLTESELETLAEREEAELTRRMRRYRGARPLPDLDGRTAILIDDGLATGVTAEAAAKAVRRLRPSRLILAVPVGAPSALRRLEAHVDRIVCLIAPEEFRSVGEWYASFDQTTDEEVVEILRTGT